MKIAESYFDSDERDRKERKKHLKQVLRNLSDYEKKVRVRLQGDLPAEEIERLEKRLALVHAQRTKGLGLLRELKEPSKD
jgi:hypothetical protein